LQNPLPLAPSAYCKGLAEETEEFLQEQGEVSFISLAKMFSLGTDFLMANVIRAYSPDIIKGRVEDDRLVTDSVKDKYVSALRGTLAACTLYVFTMLAELGLVHIAPTDN